MATDVRKPNRGKLAGLEPVYRPYRFRIEQVLKMVKAGIIPEDGSTELLDEILYQVGKSELHNLIVGGLADLLRKLIPPGYHLREDKSNSAGEWSMPEPDVAICQGNRAAYFPQLPPLEKLALVVEVCHTTAKHDRVIKFGLYAAAGIPYYGIVDARARNVTVWTEPGRLKRGPAKYASHVTYAPGQSIPVVIDGQHCGDVPVADIFPPETKS